MLRPRPLRSGALLVLALFLATNALPRASMYAHHHAGGGHAHVHPWGGDAVVHDHDDEDDDHLPAKAMDDGPGLEEPDGGRGTHVHWQSPFQHATRSEAPRLVHATIVRRLVAPLRLAAGIAPIRPASARAPPPSSAA